MVVVEGGEGEEEEGEGEEEGTDGEGGQGFREEEVPGTCSRECREVVSGGVRGKLEIRGWGCLGGVLREEDEEEAVGGSPCVLRRYAHLSFRWDQTGDD